MNRYFFHSYLFTSYNLTQKQHECFSFTPPFSSSGFTSYIATLNTHQLIKTVASFFFFTFSEKLCFRAVRFFCFCGCSVICNCKLHANSHKITLLEKFKQLVRAKKKYKYLITMHDPARKWIWIGSMHVIYVVDRDKTRLSRYETKRDGGQMWMGNNYIKFSCCQWMPILLCMIHSIYKCSFIVTKIFGTYDWILSQT